MKKYKSFLIVVCILQCVFSNVYGQVYEFSVLPGTAQWQSFNTHQEMLNACQIPENILQNMNTADLVQTCLNYPLKVDLYAYSTIKEGVETVATQFNGLSTVLSRNDNFQHLMTAFQQQRTLLSSDLASSKSDAEKGNSIFIFSFLESILSCDAVLNNATAIQKSQLATLAKDVLVYKTQNSDKFSSFTVTSSAFLLGKTLQKLNKFGNISPTTATFLNGKVLANDNVVSEIILTFNNAKL
jgi:hypothetical protein